MTNENLSRSRQLGIGTWISSGSAVITEMIGRIGFDWLLFDLEHGFMQESEVLDNIRAANLSGVRVIIRLGEFRPGFIARVLDWGADGIMMPHVSSPQEATAIVETMCYAPRGKRGYSGSARSFGFGSCAPKDIMAWEAPLFLAQIENYEGVMNASRIAETDGVDMLFTGPRDLGLDLSVRKNPSERLDYKESVKKIARAAASAGKQAGILVSPEEDITELKGYGYDSFAVGSDLAVLRAGYKNIALKYDIQETKTQIN